MNQHTFHVVYWIGFLLAVIVRTAMRAYHSRASFENGVVDAAVALMWPLLIPYWVGIGFGRFFRMFKGNY